MGKALGDGTMTLRTVGGKNDVSQALLAFYYLKDWLVASRKKCRTSPPNSVDDPV